MIHNWQCEGAGEAWGEQGRAGDQVERRGRWGEEVADRDHDDHDDEEDDDGDGEGDEEEEKRGRTIIITQ